MFRRRGGCFPSIYRMTLPIFVSLILLSMPAGGAAVVTRPNIILILADDMGWSDLGCYGGEIETPHLDRLSENGLRFTQFHNTSKCFPSRACLLTGLYAQQCGMDRTHMQPIRYAVTLAEVLKSAGYRTLMTGKHHGVDNLYDRGFDHYWGMRDGASNYFNPGLPRAGEEVPAQKRLGQRVWCFDANVVQPYTPKEKDFYSTDYYTNWALDFLERYQAEDKPFFLYVAYQAPHDPLHAWPRDIVRYRERYKVGYEAIARARYTKQKALGLIDASFPRSKPTFPDWETLSPEKQADQVRRMAVYAAMIDCMDRNIGRLLSWLEENNEWDNTLVLFASDNGSSAEVVRIGSGEIGSATRWASLEGDWANVSNTPFRFFKNYSYEGGICTPLIAHWPRGIVKPGRICHEPGHFIDIMATFIDISKAEYPRLFQGQAVHPYAGQSLLPLFRAQSFQREDPLFWQWRHGGAVRQGPWKLVVHKEQWELFDMRKDKTETQNLAAVHPEVLTRLRNLHTAWLE